MKQLINIYSLLSLLVITIGILLGYYSSIGFERNFIEICARDYNGFSFDLKVFFAIFINNSIVALLLSLGGYFTGGILTLLVLFWNGISLGTIFTLYHYTNLSLYEFASFFFIHGIFEFTAFLVFANIGFTGFIFFKRIFKSKEIILNLKYNYFLKPSLLLTFAAVVEAVLISNF